MITAFVLVHCEPGFENKMRKEISRIPEVIDVEVTYGIFDMVCKIETPNEKSLMDIILNDIRGIAKIKETQTLPIFS